MANLSSYDSDVLSEVSFHDTHIENNTSYQSVQEIQCSEQPFVDNNTEIDITSDSNIISYEQYLQETKTPVVQSTNSYAQQDALLISIIEEMSSQVAKCNKVQQENIVVNETLTAELERYKEQVKLLEQRQKFDLNDKERYIDVQLRHVIVDRNAKSKQKEDKYLDEIVDLQKKKKALDNAVFDHGLNKEIKEMKVVFNQMETEVAKCFVDKNYFEIEKRELSLDNDCILEHIICQDVMNVVMHANDHHDNVLPVNKISLVHDHSALDRLKHENDRLMNLLISQDLVHIAVNSVDILDMSKSCVDECNNCLVLETALLKKKDLIEKNVYDKLLKSYSTLEKHCISLELATQLNQEIFQKDNSGENQNAPTFNQLKESVEKVKKDIDEIKIINIGLEHSVAKLLFKNENLRKEREHLKSIYKDQFDSIKKTRVRSKEHSDSLIVQINAKSVENLDLNAQLQEKVLAIATLKNKLGKLKGKNVVDNVVSTPIATTIAPDCSRLI
ncbi:hypothetical protein Tco_0673093 [Tanacetum coccineum]